MPEVLRRFATELILKKTRYIMSGEIVLSAFLSIETTAACRVNSQEAKGTAFSADATTGKGNNSKSAEIWLKKLVKSHQVNLFLASFNNLKPQWRIMSSVKKHRPQRSQPMQPQETEIKVNLLKFG